MKTQELSQDEPKTREQKIQATTNNGTPDQALSMSKWTVAAIVGTGVFMATLDSSIVNISLPAIAHYFGVGLSGAIEWIIIAYLVVTTAMLLSIGRLADMIGRKRI